MITKAHEKLSDLIADFDVAMLVTRTAAGELRSRPMALAEIEPDGTIWFLTQSDSAKTEEIAHDNHANVAMQSKFKFVSISGTIAVHEERGRISKIWKESWRVWFPEGKDDPKLMLLRFDGDEGEYWDNSGSSGIKYLVQAGKAYLSGTEPDVERDPTIHGKVVL